MTRPKVPKCIVVKTPSATTVPQPEAPRKGILARGVLAYKDILDQPKGKFFVCVDPNPVQSLVFAVDKIDIQDDSVSLLREEAHVYDARTGVGHDDCAVIAQFSTALPWYAVNAEYVELLTTEAMARYATDDHEAMHQLEKELRPKKHDQDEEEIDKDALEKVAQLAGTGQYL